MTRKLNFEVLDQEQPAEPSRWRSRDPNPVVQMSIRLPVETYERFRTLCKTERRTNGDMLRVLMEGYFDRGRNQPK